VAFVKAYEDYCSARTDAPVLFHRYAAVAACCAALGNRVYFDAGWERVYPAIWVCFYGGSGLRKTTATGFPISLLNEVDETLPLPQDFTREALYSQLSERPSGIMRWSEMGAVLKALRRDYNAGTIETITQFWDSEPTVTRRTMGQTYRIHRPAVTILAAAKPIWFIQDAQREDVRGGFISRWLFVTAKRPENSFGHFMHDVGDRSVAAHQRASLVQHLRQLSEYEGEISAGAGIEVLERWLVKFEQAWQNENADPADLSQRAGTQIVKLAIGIMASRGTAELGELHPKAVEQAIQMYSYAFDCARDLVGQIMSNDRDRDREALDRVVSVVRAGGGTMKQRDLLRATKMTLRSLEPYLQTLVAAGRLQKRAEKTAGGPSIQYVLQEEDEE